MWYILFLLKDLHKKRVLRVPNNCVSITDRLITQLTFFHASFLNSALALQFRSGKVRSDLFLSFSIFSLSTKKKHNFKMICFHYIWYFFIVIWFLITFVLHKFYILNKSRELILVNNAEFPARVKKEAEQLKCK